MTEKLSESPEPDILVLPGLPGWPEGHNASNCYPIATSDVMKLLREVGLTVEFAGPAAPREHITLHSAELWAPILIWTSNALAEGAGGVLAHTIIRLLGHKKAEQSTLHIKCGRREPGGNIKWFEAHGPGVDVLKALRQFDKD